MKQCGLSYWLLPGLQTVTRLLFLSAWLLLAACSTYKMPLPQGNIVTEDAVARLKVGQTRAQVRLLLGTPLLTDPFHADRWDYVYRTTEDGQVKDARTFTVWFENDQLKRWEGKAAPAAKPAVPAL